MDRVFPTLFVTLLLIATGTALQAQQTKQSLIPHAQDKPPNDPRDPATAARMMTVPDGFAVELVAAEPEIVNPVAMAIDERGRFWITESLEYPRFDAGPGQDRVKILEDTDGDGKADKFTVFLDGLNIPSGIAVGHGGVWVANAPDLLFVQDTDGDGKADKQEVVVTGFGRKDTHELPNSLTWGPDGWLYGLNGVFNHSHVRYSKTNPNYKEDHPGWPITCALFRIHPRTREFQVFCEGTSNPWGVAFNEDGEAFVSACVIDHLWHLTETGYYHRQGGPYPPFTWKIESIVKHKHQKAAYCGIHYFDSDAYPEQYRGKLYMGNIHGGCLNVDRVEQKGATYEGFGEPDFLTANDAWFMPVVQKTGPDGSLYVLDWYDRYHCFQDANRDPQGIDRLKGRLYRVRYKDTPRVSPQFDLARETDQQLIERLAAKNDFVRDTARRLLQERNTESIAKQVLSRLNGSESTKVAPDFRRRLFLTLTGMSVPSANSIHQWKNVDPDPVINSWRLRSLGDSANEVSDLGRFQSSPWDRNDLVQQRQVVVAASKLIRTGGKSIQTDQNIDQLIQIGFAALAKAGDDPMLSRIVWQNLHAYLETHADLIVRHLEDPSTRNNAALVAIMPRIIDRLVGREKFDPIPIAKVVELLADSNPETAVLGLNHLSTKVQNREISADHLTAMKAATSKLLSRVFAGPKDSVLYLPAAILATSWKDSAYLEIVRAAFVSDRQPAALRLGALNALIAGNDRKLTELLAAVLDQPTTTEAIKSQILGSLSKLNDPQVADLVLARYAKFGPDLQPRAIELLTQRATWAKQLFQTIGEKKVSATVINVNQARRLKDLNDEELTKLLTTYWGKVREGRDPGREKFIAEMRTLVRKTPSDPFAGEAAFKKVCAQCHKIYGEGAEVGPDLTLNGRNDFNQLLSNVFDPSLVIGAGYRSYTVVTNGGRVLNGLLAEDSPQRVVLKVQGGKQEVIPRSEIDELNVNEISLMPEQLEKQLSPQEIADLFSFLLLDKPPSDKSGKRLPGAGDWIPKN